MVSVNGAIVTVPLTNVANAQRITLTLFSVNDGANAANVAIPTGVLLGDTNGNGSVNASMWVKLKSAIRANDHREFSGPM